MSKIDPLSSNPANSATQLHPGDPFHDEMNDNVMRALFFSDLIKPADCQRILQASIDENMSSQFLNIQQQLMPGFASYMHAPSRILSLTQENTWLLEHLRVIFDAVNQRHFKFEASRMMGTQLVSLEAGQHIDWHFDLGGGFFATRKLSMLIFLNSPDDYTGGEFDLMASQHKCQRRYQGVVAIMPAFSVSRILPVTSGRMHLLLSWFHGLEPVT
jgi:hypothetical protein